MKKLNIKAINPADIGLSGVEGRRVGAWMSCAVADVVPPRYRAAYASLFVEAATAVGLQGVGTPNAAVDGVPSIPSTTDAVAAESAIEEPLHSMIPR